MSFDLSENEIQKILTSYKVKREKERERYELVKDTDDIKNRERAKLHYENNKELRKETYQNRKELIKARNSFYYYSKKDDMKTFETKYPDRYELLLIGGYFKL